MLYAIGRWEHVSWTERAGSEAFLEALGIAVKEAETLANEAAVPEVVRENPQGFHRTLGTSMAAAFGHNAALNCCRY
jgi:hypothetical protein